MARDAIKLNPGQVKLQIDRSGFPIKQLLEDMNDKTVHRIKAGKNTTWATAHKLATKLGTTVEDLMSPITPEVLGACLPDQWLYDEAAPRANSVKHIPFSSAVQGGAAGYLIGRPPVDSINPLKELTNWHNSRGKKIVLRQEDQAFIFELHYFDYSLEREEAVVCYAATACRFFPVVRKGDTLSKVGLNDPLHRYVWQRLKQDALDNAEVVEIEGQDYPAHPHAYFPLVRFYRGTLLKRVALGARQFEQLHVDFKQSMAAYVSGIPAGQTRARSTGHGIVLTVDAVRPANLKLGWREEMLEIEVDLVWRTADGSLAYAPWRKTHRDELAEAITSRQWNEFNLRGMPVPRYPDNGEDDQQLPPFEPDPNISAASIAAINAIDRRDIFGSFWENCGDD